MKTDGNELDTLIREALTREELELYDRLGEPSLPDLLTGSFRGRLRWLNVLAMIYTFAFFGLAIACAVMVFQTDDLATMIRWGLGFGVSCLAVSALKLWFWMQMHHHALSREIKRLELAIAHLAGELRSRGGPST